MATCTVCMHVRLATSDATFLTRWQIPCFNCAFLSDTTALRPTCAPLCRTFAELCVIQRVNIDAQMGLARFLSRSLVQSRCPQLPVTRPSACSTAVRCCPFKCCFPLAAAGLDGPMKWLRRPFQHCTPHTGCPCACYRLPHLVRCMISYIEETKNRDKAVLWYGTLRLVSASTKHKVLVQTHCMHNILREDVYLVVVLVYAR